MTEAEWLAHPTVRYLEGRTSDRKLRLFACACAQLLIEAVRKRHGKPRLWRWGDSTDVAGLVAVVTLGEAFSDGTAAAEELNATRADVTRVPRNLHHSVCGPPEYANMAAYDTLNEVALDAAYGAMGCVHLGFGEMNGKEPFGTGPGFDFDVDPPLLRDIFGNPFCLVTADPAWLTSTVVSLAEGIYADSAFDRLPILADALQDGGCENADILAHCRGEGPHVRGCWVVDLLLRKE
jgi:hypothetical protein